MLDNYATDTHSEYVILIALPQQQWYKNAPQYIVLFCVSYLTFKNRASYIYIERVYRYPPDVAFYIFFSTNISTGYFKHAAHSVFLFKMPFIS